MEKFKGSSGWWKCVDTVMELEYYILTVVYSMLCWKN